MVVECVDINSCNITWDNVIKGIGNAFHSIECLIDVNFLQSSFVFQEKNLMLSYDHALGFAVMFQLSDRNFIYNIHYLLLNNAFDVYYPS